MTRFILFCSFLLLFFECIQAQQWTHVGPKSNNQQNGNGFETSQLQNIEMDPNNSNHFFAAGSVAGLWESQDGCNSWLPINTNFNLISGVSAIVFFSNNEILVSSYDEKVHKISKISKYNFVTQAWTALGIIPNPSGVRFTIKNITISPESPTILYICTSIGMFRSIDSGSTWTKVLSGSIENIVIVPYSYGTYKYYATGAINDGEIFSNGEIFSSGPLLLAESFNGTYFGNLTSVLSIAPDYLNTYGLLCVGQVDESNHELYLEVFASNEGWDKSFGLIYKINITSSTKSASLLANLGGGSSGQHTPARTALIYDPTNDGVFVGGMKLNYVYDNGFHFPGIKFGFHMKNGCIHADVHDLKIYDINGQKELYAACDGGLGSSQLISFNGANPESYISFTPLNNDLNVCLINGFSGSAQNPNLYALGGQDIVNTDIYDADLGKNIATHETWENDGTLIDKFDKNKMFFDHSSYADTKYHTSENGGINLSTIKGFYYNGGSVSDFIKGDQNTTSGELGFTNRIFYQDPYRPNRIFHVKLMSGIYQYVEDINPANSAFVQRIKNCNIEQNPGEFGIAAWSNASAMSFSPQTINSLHFVVNGASDSRPSVIKYIGKNIEDCWRGHNDATYTDGTGTHPQWATLTGPGMWENFGISSADIAGIVFLEIETSPWNKDVVYILVKIPNHPNIKVLKYNGTSWSNISNGIPINETQWCMVMDYASNDALYLATSNGVYYRHGKSLAWTLYTDPNLPKLKCSQMEINYQDNTLRLGTYGRGIWKSPLVCPSSTVNFEYNGNWIAPNIYESDDITVNKLSFPFEGPVVFRATNYVLLLPGFGCVGTAFNNDNGYVMAYIHGCTTGGTSSGYRSMNNNNITEEIIEKTINAEKSDDVIIFPNPNEGEFSILFKNGKDATITVSSVDGIKVHEVQTNLNNTKYFLQLSHLTKGIYIVTINDYGKISSKKIIIK